MSKTPKVTSHDVGTFMSDDEGNLYKVISFSAKPTFTVEALGTKKRETFVVGSPNSEHLSQLVKKENK